MLPYADAVARFRRYQSSLGIPAQARLAFVEKRSIELAPAGEIEEVIPMGSPSAPAAELPEDEEDGSAPPPVHAETLVWVGEFVQGFLFWELALDASGTLVRLRKSR